MRLLLGNFKGPEGKQGPEGQKGNTGDTGQRGSRCTSGTNVTGTSTTGTIFASTGITDSLLHDYYINTSTGNLYECTVPGPADVAEWTYICNIKGPTGATGPAGSISDINKQKPTYTVADRLENIESGETVATAFGKLKKALSLLITHYTQQATAAVLGHVKLSNSAAVTQTGLMALDAVEKNAAVPGTLAHQVQQINSNLSGRNPSSITLKRNYDYKTASGWQNILQWYDVNGRTGYLQENIGNGEIKLCLQNERGDILINGNSIAWIANNINNLKSSRNWNVILAAQADGEHEIPVLSGTEALLTLGYVYRIQATMIIPMNIFIAANGEGGKILFSGLTIEVINNTHIKVSGIESDYLFRVFTL